MVDNIGVDEDEDADGFSDDIQHSLSLFEVPHARRQKFLRHTRGQRERED